MIDYTKDNHIHTYYSPDADPKATFEAYIQQAIQLGLTEITFTDHVDFDAAHPLFHNMIQYEAYIEEFNAVKQNALIPIHLGVEIGYQEHMKDTINQFLETYSFDYVILSIHYIDKKDLYTGEFFQQKTKEEAYTKYFETCINAVLDIPYFDAFGHLDYITRYSQMGDYEYQEYRELIDELLQSIISQNKGIEINTSGLSYENRLYPKPAIINRFLELGGTKIYMGSDAHNVQSLGRSFDEVKQLSLHLKPAKKL